MSAAPTPIFTDLGLTSLGPVADVLVPWVGVQNEQYEPGRIYSGTFDNFVSRADAMFRLASLEEADLAVFPVVWDAAWNNRDLPVPLARFLEVVSARNIPVVVFAGQDSPGAQIPTDRAVILSGALQRGDLRQHEASYPHFFPDPRPAEWQPRAKGARPVVGFRGYAPPLGQHLPLRDRAIGSAKLVLNYTGFFRRYPGRTSHSTRARALIALQRASEVDTRVEPTNRFAFGPDGQMNSGPRTQSDEVFRTGFIRNILESDYTLCARGLGNNSIRLFETMSCGRVPVVVDTDLVLPLEHEIDWRRLCVWIPEADVDRAAAVVRAHYDGISDAEFTALQMECRRIWEQLLTPEGFFAHTLVTSGR